MANKKTTKKKTMSETAAAAPAAPENAAAPAAEKKPRKPSFNKEVADALTTALATKLGGTVEKGTGEDFDQVVLKVGEGEVYIIPAGKDSSYLTSDNVDLYEIPRTNPRVVAKDETGWASTTVKNDKLDAILAVIKTPPKAEVAEAAAPAATDAPAAEAAPVATA